MVLYNGMASTSPWAALYFVALMTFGNYVLFNLLVAILVEGFQAEVRRTRTRWFLHTINGSVFLDCTGLCAVTIFQYATCRLVLHFQSW